MLAHLRKGETFAELAGDPHVKIPYGARTSPESQTQVNKAHARLRSPGERTTKT